MPETLEPKIKETLRAYLRDVKALHNEANKTARFAALIGELFPDAVAQYSRDVEKLIRIDQTAGQKKGRADATTEMQSSSLRSLSLLRWKKPSASFANTSPGSGKRRIGNLFAHC
jgi:hypothetical protein